MLFLRAHFKSEHCPAKRWLVAGKLKQEKQTVQKALHMQNHKKAGISLFQILVRN